MKRFLPLVVWIVLTANVVSFERRSQSSRLSLCAMYANYMRIAQASAHYQAGETTVNTRAHARLGDVDKWEMGSDAVRGVHNAQLLRTDQRSANV